MSKMDKIKFSSPVTAPNLITTTGDPQALLKVLSILHPTDFAYVPNNSLMSKGAYRSSTYQAILIPDGVLSISEEAFAGCNKLVYINIPDTVTEIGSGAFSGCSALTEITIPNKIKTIKSNTFSGCEGLLFAYLPKSITEIEEYAFVGCNERLEIRYAGSESEWEAITKNTDWSYGMNYSIIYNWSGK